MSPAGIGMFHGATPPPPPDDRTGFTGFLTVTPALAVELGLPFEGTARATLADGSETTFPYYGVAVPWDGRTKYVEADAADTTPLVGMRLLAATACTSKSRTVGAPASSPRLQAEQHLEGGTAYRQVRPR